MATTKKTTAKKAVAKKTSKPAKTSHLKDPKLQKKLGDLRARIADVKQYEKEVEKAEKASEKASKRLDDAKDKVEKLEDQAEEAYLRAAGWKLNKFTQYWAHKNVAGQQHSDSAVAYQLKADNRTLVQLRGLKKF